MEAAGSTKFGPEEWVIAHEALCRLRLKRAALALEEGKWLLRAFRASTHAHFGFASFWEYIERLLGLGRRATEEKLRVAGALEELPALEEALQLGELTWSAVRELTRVAVPQTEREWLAVALGKTAREVERGVSGLAPGARPNARRRPELVRHVLRFEVGAETLAAFREAIAAVQKRSEHRLTDDEALLTIAREILGGPGDQGRASYQIVVTQCEDCGRGFQHANGELVALDPAILEMCHCDGQHVTISQARTTNRAPATDAQADAPAEPRGGAHADAVGGLDRRGAHVDASGRARRPRAMQDTAPAIRREVFLRDRGRCVVPGCRNASYVDLHHLDLRSEGGSNDPDNLVVLCGAHHGALHRGRLHIDGKVSKKIRFRHADGTAYGFMPSPMLAEASAQAFAGLKNLGFPEKTARAALQAALASVPANATAETLLRSAVARASGN
jgi:hypothetical protein